MKVKKFRNPALRRTVVEWVLDHDGTLAFCAVLAVAVMLVFAGVHHVDTDRKIADKLLELRAENARPHPRARHARRHEHRERHPFTAARSPQRRDAGRISSHVHEVAGGFNAWH